MIQMNLLLSLIISYASASVEFGPVPGEYILKYDNSNCSYYNKPSPDKPPSNLPLCPKPPRGEVVDDLDIYFQHKLFRVDHINSLTPLFIELSADIKKLTVGLENTPIGNALITLSDDILLAEKEKQLPNQIAVQALFMPEGYGIDKGYEFYVDQLLKSIDSPKNEYMGSWVSWIRDRHYVFKFIKKYYFTDDIKLIKTRRSLNITPYVKMINDCSTSVEYVFKRIAPYTAEPDMLELSLFDNFDIIKQILNGSDNKTPMTVKCSKVSSKNSAGISYDQSRNKLSVNYYNQDKPSIEEILKYLRKTLK